MQQQNNSQKKFVVAIIQNRLLFWLLEASTESDWGSGKWWKMIDNVSYRRDDKDQWWIYHLNCRMTSMITSSSSSKFITSIPIDFNFSIKYSSDLFDPLTSFKSLIRSLWLQTTFRTGFDLNPRTEKPNLCPKRVSSSPSRKHRV